jgi:hypothetical protein
MGVAGGLTLRTGDVRGVLTRLPYIPEAELTAIEASERAYVAAEMFAFLTFWLSRLPCPVLNRPTAGSLNGPAWHRAQWAAAAARTGMPVRSERRQLRLRTAAPPELIQPSTVVTIVGDRGIGDAHPSLIDKSRRLAASADIGFCDVFFDGSGANAKFVDVSLYPDLGRASVSDALAQFFFADRRG